MRKESLEFRNKVFKVLKDNNIKFHQWYNDLYDVKGGKVRRIKGGLYSSDHVNIKEFNTLLEKARDIVKTIEPGKFKVNLNKLVNFGMNEYKIVLQYGNIPAYSTYEEYKKWKAEITTTVILRIEWAE